MLFFLPRSGLVQQIAALNSRGFANTKNSSHLPNGERAYSVIQINWA